MGFRERQNMRLPLSDRVGSTERRAFFYSKQVVLALGQIHCKTPIFFKIPSLTSCLSIPPTENHVNAKFKNLFPVTKLMYSFQQIWCVILFKNNLFWSSALSWFHLLYVEYKDYIHSQKKFCVHLNNSWITVLKTSPPISLLFLSPSLSVSL